MFDKLKSVGWLTKLIIGALVLVWIWGPLWAFIIAVAQKAQGLFGK